MIAAIPLTVVPLLLFNILGFVYGGSPWDNVVFGLTMVSGLKWTVSLGDLMILLRARHALLRVAEGGAPGDRHRHQPPCLDRRLHHLPGGVHPGGCGGDSVFFILTAISLFDVATSFTISIRTARRDIALGSSLDGMP